MGKLIELMFPKGAKPGTNNREIVKSEDLTLQSAGITRNESSDAKIITEEKELVSEVMQEIEASRDIITPQKVARGEIATREDNLKQNTEVSDGNIGRKTLPSIGVTRKESSTSKNLASITDEVYYDNSRQNTTKNDIKIFNIK